MSATGRASHCHLVGVAGVGMSALAQALAAAGRDVSGSDRYSDQGRDLDVLRKLQLGGIRIVPQDGSGVTPGSEAVVVSTAIEADNPDVAAAQRLGVPVLHRAEMLARLMEGRRCVAVTGTSGKTTVTGMVGWLLEQAGFDPTVVNGGAVVNWASDLAVGNVRPGRSDLWVIEADESDRSLLHYSPDWAVITNMSRDHFGMDETVALFRAFRSRVRAGAVGVLDTAAELASFAPELSARGGEFVYRGRRFRVPQLGRHNAENALNAVMLCDRMGVDLDQVPAALERFRGIQRRLELAGEGGGVTVIDDYAHNTAKIAAAWETIAPYHRRILAVWRPHGFAPLANMMDDLAATLPRLCRPDDRLWILPVFYAGGTASRTVSSDQLVERLRAAGCPASGAPDYAALMREIPLAARSGDAVLIMGARDPDLPALARALVRGLA